MILQLDISTMSVVEKNNATIQKISVKSHHSEII